MILKFDEYVLDVDIDATSEYYKRHSLCECAECRNFYVQAKSALPILTEFLSKMGIDISRPDEISSIFDSEESKVDYITVAYTVVGKIIANGKHEIDINDNNLFLNILIDDVYVPNEQKTDTYFTVNVYNIRLPWVLDEPLPQKQKKKLLDRIKSLFKR